MKVSIVGLEKLEQDFFEKFSESFTDTGEYLLALSNKNTIIINNIDWEFWIGIVATVAFSSVSASVVAYILEKRKNKRAMTLEFVKFYMENYDLLGTTLHYLESCPTLNPHKINAIKRFGEWFNIASRMYSENDLDRQIFRDSSILSAAKNFYHTANKRHQEKKDLEFLSNWDNLSALNCTSNDERD